ncbi:hypothetical protein [Halegenticoccus soli]|uniref:hypothetical protein n=1 Tax=Halegenticoccus soli TaxID=1985678 RepID=UPI00117A88DC|nr:hypothetical protein [Halegenticoccus soli]
MLDYGRASAVFAAAFIAVVSVVAGPLFGSVGIAQPAAPPPGSGTADVEVRSVPAEIVLERSRFGAETFHLSGPDAVVAVDDVRGNPQLTYAVDIPDLWVTIASRRELRGAADGEVRMAFRPEEISPKLIAERRYEATVSIWLLEEGGEYALLYEETVTIEVER